MDAIREGDLVVVVRWPCCQSDLGLIFKVGKIWTPVNTPGKKYVIKCSACRAHIPPTEPLATRTEGYQIEAGTPLSWLKRIDPLAEDEKIPEEVALPKKKTLETT